ncbi:hypothetical protein F5Y12DRAFT_504119 [Xylaria sp. FL1777]|nr:hypothetical protein F5Y12DRAFT_504119 [Xylaria sp. FL1777]
MAYQEYHDRYSSRSPGNAGSNGYQTYESSGRANSHAPSPRLATQGCAGGQQKDRGKWRWQCCNCHFTNLSYTYDCTCVDCGHRRDGGCHIFAVVP